MRTRTKLIDPNRTGNFIRQGESVNVGPALRLK